MNQTLSITSGLEVWIGALLTLMVLSFLWRDNPLYKFAEHLFVGVSAAYWMVIGFWTTLWPQVIVRLHPRAILWTDPGATPPPRDWGAVVPVVLGLLLLTRLVPRWRGWSRWPTAFVLGTTAGYGLVRYLRSDFLYQIRATIGEGLWVPGAGAGYLASRLIIVAGTVCGLVYFIQTRRRGRISGPASRFGLVVLMATFGAAFASAVMGRLSLLVGRFQFLLGDWLGILR